MKRIKELLKSKKAWGALGIIGAVAGVKELELLQSPVIAEAITQVLGFFFP